jgi:hypothetical protein
MSRCAAGGWRERSSPAQNTKPDRRGFALVVFHAYDLLPPGLYEPLGYDTVGVIGGYPAGSVASWYRKDV